MPEEEPLCWIDPTRILECAALVIWHCASSLAGSEGAVRTWINEFVEVLLSRFRDIVERDDNSTSKSLRSLDIVVLEILLPYSHAKIPLSRSCVASNFNARRNSEAVVTLPCQQEHDATPAQSQGEAAHSTSSTSPAP